MSLAEIFDLPVTIAPGVDGSFIVYSGKSDPYGMAADKRGFTNVDDLVSFLQRAAKARPVGVLELAEPLVTRTVTSDVKAWPVHENIKRTSAVGTLAERIAAGDLPA